jgi:hypothetical protein
MWHDEKLIATSRWALNVGNGKKMVVYQLHTSEWAFIGLIYACFIRFNDRFMGI